MCGIQGVDTIHMYHMQHLIVSTCHQHAWTNGTKCAKIVKPPFRCLTPSPVLIPPPSDRHTTNTAPCCHRVSRPNPPTQRYGRGQCNGGSDYCLTSLRGGTSTGNHVCGPVKTHTRSGPTSPHHPPPTSDHLPQFSPILLCTGC